MCERHVTVMTLSSRHNLVFHKSNRPFLGNSSRTDHINAIDTITHLNRFVYDNNILYYQLLSFGGHILARTNRHSVLVSSLGWHYDDNISSS